MRSQCRAGCVGDSTGRGGFSVFLGSLGLSPGFDEGAADDSATDEGDLSYYSVSLWMGLVS